MARTVAKLPGGTRITDYIFLPLWRRLPHLRRGTAVVVAGIATVRLLWAFSFPPTNGTGRRIRPACPSRGSTATVLMIENLPARDLPRDRGLRCGVGEAHGRPGRAS